MKRLGLALWVVFAAPMVFAQPQSTSEKKLDLSRPYVYDSRELHDYTENALKWKRVKGIVGVGGYHIFPAHQTGPNQGPPPYIWGTGFGTSVWRDPVTGRPLL